MIRVETQTEIGPVDPLHELPRFLACVEMGAPRNTFIGKGDRLRLRQADFGHFNQILRDDLEVTGSSLVQPVCRNLDQPCTKGSSLNDDTRTISLYRIPWTSGPPYRCSCWPNMSLLADRLIVGPPHSPSQVTCK